MGRLSGHKVLDGVYPEPYVHAFPVFPPTAFGYAAPPPPPPVPH